MEKLLSAITQVSDHTNFGGLVHAFSKACGFRMLVRNHWTANGMVFKFYCDVKKLQINGTFEKCPFSIMACKVGNSPTFQILSFVPEHCHELIA